MSFNTGLSGLNAASKNLDVIGHNIANANTVGMKASRAEFAETYASSLAAAGGGGFGIGVQVAAVSQQFTQGNITVTGNDLDVAINGAGFFVLDMPNGSRAYSRAGNFKLNNEGNIVTNDGAKLLNPSTNLPIELPTGRGITGEQTQTITAELNLDTRAKVFNSVTPEVPLTTYGTTVQAYDSQGAPINVDMYFRKTAANNWDAFGRHSTQLTADYYTDASGNPLVPSGNAAGDWVDYNGNFISAADVTAGAGATPPVYTLQTASAAAPATVVATNYLGSMQFDDAGDLASTTTPAGVVSDPPIDLVISGVQVPGGATSVFSMGLNVLSVSQNASAFTITALEQDGRAPGQLTGIEIEADGKISARYSNGQTLQADQIQLANFRNVSGLAPINGGYWVETFDSGVPVVSVPGTGNFGALRSGALEESNVDLTAELVNMITAQRTYQANAQTIKTQDQILSTLVNLR
jgi:flagellar hook protein FlgE